MTGLAWNAEYDAGWRDAPPVTDRCTCEIGESCEWPPLEHSCPWCRNNMEEATP